jgi:hypothetical protein
MPSKPDLFLVDKNLQDANHETTGLSISIDQQDLHEEI